MVGNSYLLFNSNRSILKIPESPHCRKRHKGMGKNVPRGDLSNSPSTALQDATVAIVELLHWGESIGLSCMNELKELNAIKRAMSL